MTATGCVATSAGRREARAIVHARLHADVATDDGADVDGSVKALLARPLTADVAVRVAMLRNADVKAALDRIGIARGELVGALALPNPSLEGDVRFRSGKSTPDVDVGGLLDLRDFVLLPLRKRAAADELDASAIEAAGWAMDVAQHVREAYVDYLAAREGAELERSVVDALDASATLAKKLRDAGNTAQLSSLNAEAELEEARLDLTQTLADEAAARYHLNLLMGLAGEEATTWNVSARLAPPPLQEIDTKNVETTAVDASLDLAELRARGAAADGRVDLATVSGVLPSLQGGVLVERDPDGWSVGPQAVVGIPIFNQGEGDAATARAERSLAEAAALSTASQIRSLARTLAVDLGAARERALAFQSTVLPLRRRIVDETELQYNAMGASAFELFDAKRREVESARGYVAALDTYWKTRGQLEMLLAGRMPDEALTGMSLVWQSLRSKELPRR